MDIRCVVWRRKALSCAKVADRAVISAVTLRARRGASWSETSVCVILLAAERRPEREAVTERGSMVY
jgi:hypothetical protein